MEAKWWSVTTEESSQENKAMTKALSQFPNAVKQSFVSVALCNIVCSDKTFHFLFEVSAMRLRFSLLFFFFLFSVFATYFLKTLWTSIIRIWNFTFFMSRTIGAHHLHLHEWYQKKKEHKISFCAITNIQQTMTKPHNFWRQNIDA